MIDDPRRKRRLLLSAGGLVTLTRMSSSLAGTTSNPIADWERMEFAPAGFASDLAERLDQGVESGKLLGLHAVVIVRHGKLVLERYYRGEDNRWGEPLGIVDFTATTLHDIRSITKSIVGMLYGIALAERKVPSIETPVLDAFPEYRDLAKEADRRRIRIADVLTMTMGLEWNEDLPYSDSRNSEIAMEHSADRYRYVLDRPIVSKAGEKWQYSGGSTAILGRLIARGAGVPLLDYARQKLFGPLGIVQVEWTKGLNGEAAAASGLRMTARDLAKVGQMVLQRGRWQERSVVPEAWLSQSLTPYTDGWPELKYGYQWHLASAPNSSSVYLGLGLGGQRLSIFPERESVSVIFMGNYLRTDQLERLTAVRNVINAAVH